jgi:hypothetical protein
MDLSVGCAAAPSHIREVDMKHKCISFVRLFKNSIERSHFFLVVLLSVLHIGLAAMHPRISGRAHQLSSVAQPGVPEACGSG